jgi:hypothetical protein
MVWVIVAVAAVEKAAVRVASGEREREQPESAATSPVRTTALNRRNCDALRLQEIKVIPLI